MPKSEQENSSEEEASKTVSLTDRDLKDAARLLRLLADPASPPTGQLDPSPRRPQDRETLIAKARMVLDCRRQREHFFNRNMFGEPAWDILLMLYVAEPSSGRLTMSRLAEWVGAPPTTVARWVKFLEEERLVERKPHPTDRRTVFISLLQKGRAALDSYLEMLPG